MAIILSIKVDEMEKKIKVLTNEKESANLLEVIKEHEEESFSYDEFKTVVLALLGEIKEKIKIS